ncbi:MAG: hypothetical protein Q8R76_04570 [Candidatus Omnitrophota bacterium]|nr:hypothetical protein [Candidatus Omnitrophota bacterium]
METPDSKRERFRRLAAKRTNEVIKKLDILGHCGNKHSYEYSDAQIKEIFLAVDKKLNDVRDKFKPKDETFRL